MQPTNGNGPIIFHHHRPKVGTVVPKPGVLKDNVYTDSSIMFHTTQSFVIKELGEILAIHLEFEAANTYDPNNIVLTPETTRTLNTDDVVITIANALTDFTIASSDPDVKEFIQALKDNTGAVPKKKLKIDIIYKNLEYENSTVEL